ncbi:MAG: fluoride efflux transporter CrcB [Rhodospirillales bacterium]|nr:fluoride efflux transporter CrcB [Rhodospirillales bacterium]
MLNYALIGLGGALGSMARAWVAVAMARVTGPAFPWGTILVNILGSFLIGFVGSLTATDGRLGGTAELRTLIMVGFCGGFTTFSSFSLQTLDLARDGRPGQAFGNVALSLLLCLGSVAVGHVAGVKLRPGREMAEVTPAQRGGGILAVLDRAETTPAVLDAAARWRALAGGGPVRALAVHPAPATSFLPSEEVLTDERLAELIAVRHDHLAAIQAAFETWRQAQPTPTPAAWSEVEGHPAAVVAARGRDADGIVIARPGPHDAAMARETLHAALFDTDRPVLLLPPVPRPGFGRAIAVAWRDGDRRAEAALGAALPLLRRAERIAVLVAGDRPLTMPPQMRDTGVPAQLVAVRRGEAPVGAGLLAAAEANGADLLVMGAFSHGAWREAILGGVTRHVLAHARMPVLLRH